MGKLHFLSMKGAVIGIFAVFILILIIPLLIVVSQEKLTLHGRMPVPTPAVVLSSETGQASIAGYVYHDTNKDGQRKEEEKSFKDVGMEMKILKENGDEDKTIAEVKTDSYGYFSFRITVASENSYMLKVILPQGYQTSNSNPVILSEIKPNTQKIVEFGLYSLTDIPTISPTKKSTIKPTATTDTPIPSIQP